MNQYELIAANDITQTPLREDNKLRLQDRAVHDWYRFVLSFPPHLVRDYLQRFGVDARQRVLDPFGGLERLSLNVKSSAFPASESNQTLWHALPAKLRWIGKLILMGC
jgi:hypothetical protein